MLHTLRPDRGSRTTSKRLGRGSGSGTGTTAGKGTKGQRSRAGKGRRYGFEGGQTPLLRRQPKIQGFTSPNKTEYEVINVGTLEEKLDAGEYNIASLRDARILRTKRPVKILGRGELKKKFTLTVDAVSVTAKEAIEKAGGSVTVLS